LNPAPRAQREERGLESRGLEYSANEHPDTLRLVMRLFDTSEGFVGIVRYRSLWNHNGDRVGWRPPDNRGAINEPPVASELEQNRNPIVAAGMCQNPPSRSAVVATRVLGSADPERHLRTADAGL
jgi:hypothetical protein